MNEADLLVVLGASFSNHTGIYPRKPIIQVDFDPLQLGKFHPVTVPVWGDVGVAARLLADGLAARSPRPTSAATSPRAGRSGAAEKASRARRRPRPRASNSAAVFAALHAPCPDDAVIAVDVGNHAYSFGRYFECRARPS